MREKLLSRLRAVLTYRGMAVLGAVVLGLSLVPLLVMGLYNHPCADDYNYGIACAHVVQAGGSPLELLSAAGGMVRSSYWNWQGTFSAVFLMSLQPAVFGEGFYAVTPFLMLGSLLFSTFFFLKTLCGKVLGMERSHWVTVGCALCFFSVQFAPSAFEGFYWFNGAVFYTFFHSLALCLYAFVLKTLAAPSRRALAGDLTGGCLLSVIVGGGNYPTALLTLLVLLGAFVWSLVKKAALSKRLGLLAFLLLEAAGLVVSMAAPGNSVRQGYFETRPTAVGAILLALKEACVHGADYLTAPFLLTLLALAPIFCRCAARLSFRFPLPVLAPVAAVCVLGVLMTPPIYAMNSTGGTRMQDMYYYAFCLLVAAVDFYFCGWAVHRADGGLKGELSRQGAARWVSLSLALLLAAGLLCVPTAKESANSVMAFESLRTHEAQIFHKEMQARIELYLDPEVKDVVVEPLSARPAMLFPSYKPDLSEDPEKGINKLIAQIYHKDSVRVEAK